MAGARLSTSWNRSLFKDPCLFFPSFPAEDQVRAYAVYGGTPAYLDTIDPP